MTDNPLDTTPGVSRAGLILGAAGIAGAAALAALPGTAAAAATPARTIHRQLIELTTTSHPDYHRRHFDRAKATAVVRTSPNKTMTLRVDDLVALPHTATAKHGSAEWSAGFSALLTRTKGTPVDTGTYPTTINGRTFPLTIIRVGENTYQVGVDRRIPKNGG